MSDTARALTRRTNAASLAAGLASCLLFLSLFLSFAFLVPVQFAYGRFGRRAGAAAAGVAAAGIAVVQGWRIASMGVSGPFAYVAGILPPLVLLGALVLLNLPIWGGWAKAYRVISVAAACALCAIPLLVSLESDASLKDYLQKLFGDFLSPLRSALGDGYEASALAASLDPGDFVATFLLILRNSYAALLLLYIGGSYRIGNRLSGPGSRGREETAAIDELRLPYPLLWGFLASWSLVLAAVLLHAPEWASAIAWNCALALSLAYAAQGFGIVTHVFKRWKMPRSLRILFVVMAVLALATPTAGIAVLVALPLLGVTEIWIPYRKPKGVGA